MIGVFERWQCVTQRMELEGKVAGLKRGLLELGSEMNSACEIDGMKDHHHITK